MHGEGVVDVEVEQRRQVAHQVGVRHLLRRQLDVTLEGGHLFGQVAQVVEQQDVAVAQGLDGPPGHRAGHVVHEAHRPAQPPRQGGGVLGQVDEVVVVEGVALVGDQHHARPAVGEVADRGHALVDAVEVGQLAGLEVDGGVDVHPQ